MSRLPHHAEDHNEAADLLGQHLARPVSGNDPLGDRHTELHEAIRVRILDMQQALALIASKPCRSPLNLAPCGFRFIDGDRQPVREGHDECIARAALGGEL